MTQSQDPIVMGPESLDTPGDMLDAPRLTSKTDKFAYRRSVRMWYDCVQSSAECGYSKAKGTAGNLGHALFTKMDPRYKKIITSAIDSGALRLRTHRDGAKYTDEDHVKCVELMLSLVAKESSTDRVKRLIRMMKEVYECKRDPKESYQEYSDRFEGLARAYLSLAKVRPESPDEQNFAIIAIENAGLPISTYNTIINNLVSHARDNIRQSYSCAPTSILKEIALGVPKIHSMLQNVNSGSSEETRTNNELNVIIEASESLNNKIRELVLPEPEQRSEDEHDEYVISLSKALEELRYVKTEDELKHSSTSITPYADKTEKLDNEKVKGIGTMMGNWKANGNNGWKRQGVYKSRYNNRFRRYPSYYRKKHAETTNNDEEYTDHSTDEEREVRPNKKGNIFNRLGERKMDIDYPTKKVRFELGAKRSFRSRNSASDTDGDSDVDTYFYKGDRRRS